MYMGYPSDISKSVAQLDSFHLEFCWMESPGKRQRLVRTYDSAGLAVSSTYFSETKVWVTVSSYKMYCNEFCKWSNNLTNYFCCSVHDTWVYILRFFFSLSKRQKFINQAALFFLKNQAARSCFTQILLLRRSSHLGYPIFSGRVMRIRIRNIPVRNLYPRFWISRNSGSSRPNLPNSSIKQ